MSQPSPYVVTSASVAHEAESRPLFPLVPPPSVNAKAWLNEVCSKFSQRKGDYGRVAIFGGSREYVGAPVFAARGAMAAGAELVYICTTDPAVIPIKTLLPDAIVRAEASWQDWASRFRDSEHWVVRVLPSIDAIVLGCGFGYRHTDVRGDFELILRLIELSKKNGIPLILDGDALRILLDQMNPNTMLPLFDYKDTLQGSHLILTPNVREAKRFEQFAREKYAKDPLKAQILTARSTDPIFELCSLISVLMEPADPTILLKGFNDLIYNSAVCRNITQSDKCSRRIGGQGDIIAGRLGAKLAIVRSYEKRITSHERGFSMEIATLTRDEAKKVNGQLIAAICEEVSLAVARACKAAVQELGWGFRIEDVLNLMKRVGWEFLVPVESRDQTAGGPAVPMAE